jgi:periplasmic protein TonB
MFNDTLNASWDERSRRGVTTLTSFGLQALAVAVLLVLPLLRPTGLPLLRQLSTPVSIGQPLADAPAIRTHAGANAAAPSSTSVIILRPSTRFQTGTPATGDDAGQIAGSGPLIPGGMKGDPHGLQNWFESGTRPVFPAAPAPVTPRVRISIISEGNLIRKVQPTYPPLARAARLQGQVVLQAVISKQGAIENLRVLSGHPMFVPAAIEAVRQWRYRPYILNSDPVEVETQITVNFSLTGN